MSIPAIKSPIPTHCFHPSASMKLSASTEFEEVIARTARRAEMVSEIRLLVTTAIA
jgi:hypothetical protein